MRVGAKTFRKTVTFLKSIFLSETDRENVGDVLIVDPENKVSKSAYLSTIKNKLNLGSVNQDTFEIQRARTSSGTGVDLDIKAGNGFGTDKAGGDLNLYGGASTGNVNGGSIRFWQGSRSGTSGTSLNTWTEMFNTEITQGRLNFIGAGTLYFPDKDADIVADQSIELIMDYDNDATNDYLAIKDSAITRALFPDEGNLYLMSASNATGLFLDAVNSTISAGSKAAHSGIDANTDNTGGVNQTGVDLTITGGAGTGSGDGGGISFGTYPGGAAATTVNSTYEEKMAMDKDGNLQIDGNLTPAGIVLDGNTITGVDDSGEFTNDDAHIMTSAAIEDKILGYGYGTGSGDITGITISDGTTAHTTTSGTHTTQFLTGEGIDVAINNLSATVKQVTYSAEDASATNKGVVELATTGEADTGTDTARAVTPAGLKSHVDTRFSYQYISFTGSATVPSDGDWITVSANGISNHTWNTNLGSGGTTVGSSTVTIPTGAICQGIIVPYDCTLVGYTSLIRSIGNHQSKVGLAVGVPTYNDFATFDCTLRAYNAADISAGPDSNYSQRPVRADYLTANHSMSAGHVIFPLIGSVASNSRTVQWNCTLVLKTLLP
jgi:hypothetical protein